MLTKVTNPVINSVSPDSAAPGESKTVTFTGTNLLANPTIGLGDDIIVDQISAAGTTATARITPTSTATETTRTGTWTNENGCYTTFTFTVLSAPTTTTTTTTTSTTTTTIPSPNARIILVTPPSGVVGSGLPIQIVTENIPSDASVTGVTFTNTRNNVSTTYINPSFVSGVVSLSVTPTPDDVGRYNVSLTFTTPSAPGIIYGVSLDGALTIEMSEGFAGVYMGTSAGALGAFSPANPARIAYTLSADKAVDIFIQDLKEAKPLYHRKFAAGASGGTRGYNEILWDGKTDFGNTIPNGIYLLQIVSGNRVVATYKFAVGVAK